MDISTMKTGAAMKKFFLATAALAAWVSAGFAGIGVNWTAGGRVYGVLYGGGDGIAAESHVTWQLIWAGPNGVADGINLEAEGWAGGDDVVLAVREVPAGGGVASDGTEWDACLAKVDGDSVYEDLEWTEGDGFVFQRIWENPPLALPGASYYQSGLFQVRGDYVGGPMDFSDMFGAAAGVAGGAVWTTLQDPPWDEEEEGEVTWQYSMANGEATITGAEPADGNLAIPAMLDGCPVTGIGNSAFDSCEGLTGVTIPASVKRIGESAFRGCSALTSVELPEGLKRIESLAFYGTGLETVTVPKSVRWIGGSAFASSALLSATVLGGAISGEDGAFFGCSSLKTLTLGTRVSAISYHAFANYSARWAALETVHAPVGWEGTTSPLAGGFFGADFAVVYDNAVDDGEPTEEEEEYEDVWRFRVVDDGAVVGMYSAVGGKVVIPSTLGGYPVTAIEDYAFFHDGDVITSLRIPDSVRSVGSGAFANCSVLTALSVPGAWKGTDILDNAGVPAGCQVVYRGAEDTDAHNGVQLWEGGPYWAETNIGAEEPWEYGLYFWWGDTVGYRREGSAWVASDGSATNFSFEEGNAPTCDKTIATLESGGWVVLQDGTYVLAPEYDAAQVQWGGGWRMPTEQELEDLCENQCDWTWTRTNGVWGFVVRGRGDFAEASIFVPAAGYGSWTRDDAGYSGHVWSSVPLADEESDGSGELYFNCFGYHAMEYGNRYDGLSIRPLRESAVVEPVKYPITVGDGVEGVYADNGESRTEAAAGETLTVEVGCPIGMRLVGVYVNGDPIEGTTFVMPAAPVTVTAEFEEGWSSWPAEVTIGEKVHQWDGTPKEVAVATEPPGLAVRVTYDGSTNRPSAAGVYDVVATVADGFYEGSARGTLVIVEPGEYLVVDMSGGTNATRWPVTKLDAVPEGGWTDEYKTTKLVLRKVEAGTYTMGSPTNELGRITDGTLHETTLSRPFYIGVFEVTQKQWELATGGKPSSYKGDMRPVESVRYHDIRGSASGAGWPGSGKVDASSFLGRLRAKVPELAWDLPTEAQWEYACRAGTTTALNSGKNLTATNSCPNMAEVGRYTGNQGDGKGGYGQHTVVGSYLPNAWGLYDMHGNVYEWCLDWYAEDYETGAATDPAGRTSGTYRVQRGGGWDRMARACRSAYRDFADPVAGSVHRGLRLVCPDVQGQTIEWVEIGTATEGEQVELAATATSGGEVRFVVVSGPGRIDGNMLTFTGWGTVVVKATQAGGGIWAAVEATQTIEVGEAPKPDLAAEWVRWPGALRPGEAAVFAWTVTNAGLADAAGSWTEEVWISNEGGALRLAATNVAGTIARYGSAAREIAATVPEYPGLAGPVWLSVRVNADGGIAELSTGRENNEATAGLLGMPSLLTLELATCEVKENAGSVRCVVRRSGPVAAALTVGVASSREGDVSVPATMTIAAGARSGSFTAVPVDNSVVDGTRTAVLSVSAEGYEGAAAELRIVDNEVPALKLEAESGSVREGGTLRVLVSREGSVEAALAVQLSGLSSGRVTGPSSVEIPAGERSAVFELAVPDNETAQAETSVTLRAGAAGYKATALEFLVLDDDVPGVRLELYPEAVGEGAGANAVRATLARTDTSKQMDQAIRVRLAASPAGQLIVPSEVVIPARTVEVRFGITPVDNGTVEGDARTVTIDGQIMIASCGCGGQPSNGDAIRAVLTLLDNDVPALSLKAEPATMKEGLAEAGWLVLSHNSALEEDLEVELSCDTEGEIEIPATVTIAAGETSVRVPVRTLDDGVEDGAKLVSVYAEDPSGTFEAASTWLQVSDQNLPDLAVAWVDADAAAVGKAPFAVRFAVTNAGFAACTRSIPYAVHLVDARGMAPGSNTLVAAGTLGVGSGLAVGGMLEVEVEVTAPEMPRDIWVAVALDPSGTITELDNANNTGWSGAVGVAAAWTATVAADAERYLPGDTVALTGTATLAGGGAAAGVDVDVYLMMNGMRRTLKVRTGADGAFATNYVPSVGEAGHYSVGACYPGVGSQAEQDEFDVLGMKRANSGNVIWDIGLGDTATRTITLRNQSGAALTGLTAEFTGVPDDCELSWELPETLAGNGSAALKITATAAALTEGGDYEAFSVRVATAEGIALEIPLYFHSQTQKAYLRASPSSVNTTMAVGHERYIDVTVVNDGKGDTGEVAATVPAARWLKIAAGARTENLGPGESMTVTLLLCPEESDGLTLNSPIRGGRLAVNCANGTGCGVSLAFTPVSEATGSVVVDAVDNNTYTLESAPHLAGASVRLANPYTGAAVAGGTTGSDGAWSAEGIPVGRYQLTVTAPNHETHASEIDVEPGATARKTAFLQYRLVSATWEVVRTEIEDQYDVQLTLDYETSVPAPNVRVSMPDQIDDLEVGEHTTFTVHLENTGMIAAENVSMTFPEIEGHVFTLMDNHFKLAAGASRDIPVKFENVGTSPAARGKTTTVLGTWIMKTLIFYICGDQEPSYELPVKFKYRRRVIDEDPETHYIGPDWPVSPTQTNRPPSVPIRDTNSVPINVSTGSLFEAVGRIVEKGCQFVRTPCGESLVSCVADLIAAFTPGETIVECPLGIIDCAMDLGKLKEDFSWWKLAKATYGCGKSLLGCVGLSQAKAIILSLGGCALNLGGDCAVPWLVDKFKKSSGRGEGVRATEESDGGEAFFRTYPGFAAAVGTVLSYDQAVRNWLSEMFGDESWGEATGEELVAFLEICDGMLAEEGSRLSAEALAAARPDAVSVASLERFVARWNRYLEEGESDDDEWADAGTTDGVRPSYIVKCAEQMDVCREEMGKWGYSDLTEFLRRETQVVVDDINAQQQAVCASVEIKFSQTVAMTREAFDGTLTMYNGNGTTPIRNLKLELSVLDAEGNECRDLFEAFANGTAGDMEGENVLAGGMTVAAGGTGSAMVRFIPERGAAPTEEKLYRFGGTVTYTDPFSGEQATIQLTPVSLTVSPSPYLHLDYFVQRDVYGDDPFTGDVVEASLPAEMAVLVRNVGGGEARNVTISSVQPETVRNEKGLAIDFRLSDYSLDSMALNGATAHLGMNTASLGTIPAGASQVAQWWLTASIQGHFTGMSASVVPVNSWNTPDTMLVDTNVAVHKLIRSVVADADALPDFLTSEEGDLYGRADTIWLSGSGQAVDVAPAGSMAVEGSLTGSDVTLSVTMGATARGWTYGWTAVPGAERYEIARVARADGSEVPLRNAWITDRVFRDGADPVWETRLHIVDECVEGERAYTVSLVAKPSDGPEVVAFEGVEPGAVLAVSLDSLAVVFSTEVDGATFGTDDLVLRWQGTRVDDLSGLSISGEGTRWTISGLASVCAADGRYELIVQAAGIANLSGALGTNGKSVSWTVSGGGKPAVLRVEGIEAGTELNGVGDVTVVFSVPVASFGALALRLDGASVQDVTVSGDETGTRWVIGGLDACLSADGEHTLTVVGASVTAQNGQTGAADASVSWIRDTVGPEVLGVEREEGLDGEVFRVALDETVPAGNIAAGAATLVHDGSPVVWPAGASWAADGSGGLVLSGLGRATAADGRYVLTVLGSGLRDAAGNAGTGSASVSWAVDTVPPEAVAGLRIDPDTGSSDSDGVTCEAAVTVRGTLAADVARVTVLVRYASGEETVLSGPFAPEGTELVAAITLPVAGNQTLVVRCEDEMGNAGDTELAVYLDAIPAEAAWDAVEDGTLCESAVLRFSAAMEAADVTPERFALSRDGVPVALDGVGVSATDGGAAFELSGLDALCAETGTYELRFDGEGVRKAGSGLPMGAGIGAAVSWTYVAPDREPPVVTAVRIDGGAPDAERWDRAGRIEVEFSETVNVPELVGNGLIAQAFKLFGPDGVAFAAPGEVEWNARANTAAWRLAEGTVGYGEWRLVLDAGLLADAAGNALSGEGWGTAPGLCRFASDGELFVSVSAQAAPSWGDIDGDGVAELLVGEKTSAGTGDIRVWRNAGTAETPKWESAGLLADGGETVEVAASGCLGASVAVADLTGNGHADLAIGTWDGRLLAREGGATPGTWNGEVELLAGGAEYGSARAVLSAYDPDGAGWCSLLAGGMDGRFREITWWPEDTNQPVTLAWLADGEGRPLEVASGFSAPVAADVNGDGLADIVSGDAEGGLWAFLADGKARWCPTPVALREGGTAVGTERSRPAWGDMDGDGTSDLLVGYADGRVLRHALLAASGPCVPFTVLRTPPTLAEAVDAPELEWTTGGDNAWAGVWTNGATGGHAGLAGTGTSWLATSTEGEGRLVFRWRTTDGAAGSLALEGNGTALGTWTADGSGEWHRQAVVFGEGSHALRWTWTADGGATGAGVWLDAVVWTPSPWTELDTHADRTRDDFAEWLVARGLAPEGASVEMLTAASFEDTDGDGADAWGEFVAMTDPGDSSDFFEARLDTGDGRTIVTWEPNRPTDRAYRVFARETMDETEPWTEVGGGGDFTGMDWRFFRVGVRLWE